MSDAVNQTQMQAIFDSYPDSEPLLEFDDFFVGGNTLKPPALEHSDAHQLINMRSLSDLKVEPVTVEPECVLEVEDDLEEFSADRIEILDDASYESLFVKGKRSAYARFDYLKIKSCESDVPLRERDLLLTEDDKHLIKHLRNITADYFAVEHMAELCAYREMGISFVSFHNKDGCPLCLAFEGLFFEINDALIALSERGGVTHPFCSGTYSPVIFRGSYDGPLSDVLASPTVQHGGVSIQDAPAEMLDGVKRVLDECELGSCTKVVFVDMSEFGMNSADEVEDTEGLVSLRRDETIFVHNSYVDLHGPVVFLRKALTGSTVFNRRLDPSLIASGELFLFKGRSVVQVDGQFWDTETGERIGD